MKVLNFLLLREVSHYNTETTFVERNIYGFKVKYHIGLEAHDFSPVGSGGRQSSWSAGLQDRQGY